MNSFDIRTISWTEGKSYATDSEITAYFIFCIQNNISAAIVVTYCSKGSDWFIYEMSDIIYYQVFSAQEKDQNFSSGAGNDILYGQAGNDSLFGGYWGNDTLEGGLGNDTMNGGNGDDLYIVDSLYDVVHDYWSRDRYAFVPPHDDAGANDTIQASITYSIKNIYEIENLILSGASAINGTGNDWNNQIRGNDNNNLLDGGAGEDTLFGYAGNDTFQVGAGNDSLLGDSGSDVYLFNRGGGKDLIFENGGLSTETDSVQFGSGKKGTAAINYNQLWFKKISNDLKIEVLGTTDSVTIQNWFLDLTKYTVEQIKTSDGKILSLFKKSASVVKLVEAMASLRGSNAMTTTQKVLSNNQVAAISVTLGTGTSLSNIWSSVS